MIRRARPAHPPLPGGAAMLQAVAVREMAAA